MAKHSFFYGLIFVIFLGVFSSTSCNSNEEDKNASNPSTNNSTIALPTAPVIAGILDTLWVDSSAFASLKDKDDIVFSFYTGGADTLTLHGWNKNGAKKDSFSLNPEIKLIKGLPAGVSYGTGTYYSNIILRQKNLKHIQDLLISTHAKFVLFAPEKTGGHITYKIYLSNENPAALVKTLAVIPTNDELNPSPPKNY